MYVKHLLKYEVKYCSEKLMKYKTGFKSKILTRKSNELYYVATGF